MKKLSRQRAKLVLRERAKREGLPQSIFTKKRTKSRSRIYGEFLRGLEPHLRIWALRLWGRP